MPRSRYPWYKRYPGDWLNDQAVRALPPAAKGIWADLLEMMHLEATDRVVSDVTTLCRRCGCAPDEMVEALNDLKETGAAIVEMPVSDVSQKITPKYKEVTVICKRLSREYKEREQNRLRQQRHRKKVARNGAVAGEKSEVRSQMSERGRKTTRARGALGASDDALFSPSDTGKTQKRDPKKRDPELIKAAGRFIEAYRERDNFQCSDATIRKKFYALVEDGIHTTDAIFWLLGEWEKSEEWKKGYRCAPDKFLARANQKYRKPPPLNKRGGSLSQMDYTKGFDDV